MSGDALIMQKFEIRKAEVNDLNAWAKMRNQLWPDKLQIHRDELQEFFSGTSIDIVATYVIDSGNDDICGFIELNLRNFAEGSRNGQVPYIEGWYIKPAYQNQGLGKQLMQQAETWAKQQGFSELASDTEIDNIKSQTIHKKLGFEEVERVVCFLKKI